ncbi:hypothetical protein M3P05_19385 [Sansalvadorimonas sp. 2012CJ34-2]|uniref:Lipoprotein n=1 Tax=Parendozoicomonas callyspongiae TaxID=2942213 RepID=A0ABT0PL33_9GAMM|nr:hypothetical protein [Sansalvadorimonas sp. 2012CJ34-2]MCL6272089.1 hypothetical protein [Sansalvadorimonas sp. 2012CJ34-2]
MKFQKIALATAIAISIAGCKGGGGSSSTSGSSSTPPPTNSPVITGQFYDAPTNGLWYKSSAKPEGAYTTLVNEKPGAFLYTKENEIVEFRLGGPDGLLLGKGEAQDFVMPQDIAKPAVALNMSRILLALNSAGNDSEIDIPDDFQVAKNKDRAQEIAALAKINLLNLDATKDQAENILSDVISSSQSIQTANKALEHLSRSTDQVMKSKKKDEDYDPVSDGFNIEGKIVRTDNIRLSYGSGTNKQYCYVDLTKTDKKEEVEKSFGYLVYKEGVTSDGKVGSFDYEGSNDTWGVKLSDKSDFCSIDQAEKTKGIVTIDGQKGEFEAYPNQGDDGLELYIPSNEISGYSFGEKFDVDYKANGSVVVKEGKTQNGMPVATGDIKKTEDIYNYSKSSGVIVNHKKRFKLDASKGKQLDTQDGPVWVWNSKSDSSEYIELTYEVKDAKNPAAPLYVDLNGNWEIDVFDKKCGLTYKEYATFSDQGVTWKWKETVGGTGPDKCNFKPYKTDENESYEDEYGNSDLWFFAYNQKYAGQKGAKATLAQLNSRVKWQDEDDGMIEYVRWVYVPEGSEMNNGTLYRYKEEANGTVSYINAFRRKQ